jgi:CO/xanthine dehydrogenase Mo-binding subunit
MDSIEWLMAATAFLEDIFPHNFLYAITIRSPVAKGRLKAIQFPRLPENYFSITAADIPGENMLEETSMPILANKKLSYIGEPIAIILGQDKTKLEEFAGKCVIAAEEEKPVFTGADAMVDEPAAFREIHIGDPESVFQKSGKIVTGSYNTGIQDHWYAEPTGAITWYKGEKKGGALVVKTATQWPYHVKRSVSRVLKLDPASVSVETSSLSMHMDGKLWYPSLVACHAALGTYITRRPVRLILNREEDFLYSPKRCGASIDILSVVDDNGNIEGSEVEIAVNLGAYAVNSEEILDQTCLGALGCYNTDNIKLTARANLTNIPPQGPYSGFGLSQGLFALERHVSLIADMAGKDPALWRIDKLNPGLILSSLNTQGGRAKEEKIPSGELVETAAKMSDYYRKWASYELLRRNRHDSRHFDKGENPRGIGIAVGFQGNGLLYTGKDNGNYGVEVTLTKDGRLEIKTCINSSESYNKIWEKIASQTIAIEPEMVRIITQDAPDCGPSCASRNITAVTKMVEKCCIAIRKQRFHDPLPITVKRTVKPQHGALWGGRFTPPDGKHIDISGFTKLGMACAAVEVSIDLVECIPKIRGVWLAVDGGKIVSTNRAKRSITRNTVQALGWSFTEYIEYTGGILPKSQYDNFAILPPADIPTVNIEFLPDGEDPKGIGELPYTCIPAAFIQAVSQAMDYSFKSIPLKRKEIWEMVRLKKLETPAQESK